MLTACLFGIPNSLQRPSLSLCTPQINTRGVGFGEGGSYCGSWLKILMSVLNISVLGSKSRTNLGGLALSSLRHSLLLLGLRCRLNRPEKVAEDPQTRV